MWKTDGSESVARITRELISHHVAIMVHFWLIMTMKSPCRLDPLMQYFELSALLDPILNEFHCWFQVHVLWILLTMTEFEKLDFEHSTTFPAID